MTSSDEQVIFSRNDNVNDEEDAEFWDDSLLIEAYDAGVFLLRGVFFLFRQSKT